MDHTPRLIVRELRRIGVDGGRLGAVATRGATAEVLLRWLRWLPTGLGQEEFMRRLDTWADDGGLKAAMHDRMSAPADAGRVNADEIVAVARELERVAPSRGGEKGSGMNFPRGRTHALTVLRTLPDGAGIEAVTAALNADRA